MKKILFLFLTVFCAYTTYAQYTVDQQTVLENTAKLTPRANWTEIELSGKYPRMVELARDVLDGQWINLAGYTVIIPSTGNHVDWINMDLSSDANETYLDGIFLDGSNPKHYIIKHNASGFEAPAECLNPIKYRIRYTIKQQNVDRYLDDAPPAASLYNNRNKIIINKYCCEDKKQELNTDNQKIGLDYYDNYGSGTYGKKIQNDFPISNFAQDFQIESKKEKTFFGRYVVPALIGLGTAVLGFVAWDGLSDGEWFDFNGTKPQTIIRQLPPREGPGPSENGIIFRW